MINIGYTNYIIALLIATGLLILYIDVKAYDREKKKRRQRLPSVRLM
ncbi:CLC_0170 family protein [Salicibibacter kimchii]|nr:CLC_0170 family protein [Salicibibacter kimchii]